jgi:hypothetical protein
MQQQQQQQLTLQAANNWHNIFSSSLLAQP